MKKRFYKKKVPIKKRKKYFLNFKFQVEMRGKLNDSTSWNTLFLNPNSILAAIAKKFNIKKVFYFFYLSERYSR